MTVLTNSSAEAHMERTSDRSARIMNRILSTIRSRRSAIAIALLCLVALVASACGGEDEAAHRRGQLARPSAT